MTRRIILFLTLALTVFSSASAQSIADKISGNANSGDLSPELQKTLVQVNRDLRDWRTELQRLYREAEILYRTGADENEYRILLEKINLIRENIILLEDSWRLKVLNGMPSEQYALWHQPETTLGDLIIDYGSQNFVYLLTPELATMKLSVNSSLPIPRASWDEMLETLLIQNGVGYKQLNPYLRQLYLLKDDRSPITLITNKRSDLVPLPPKTRICFVLTPDPSETRRIWFFLDKFVNPNTTVLQNIGRDILIIATVGEVKELLKLYDFAIANQGDREYRVIPLKRADSDEIAKVLSAIFDQFSDVGLAKELDRDTGDRSRQRPRAPTTQGNGVQVIPLRNIAPAIVVIGTIEEIKKAAKIIKEVESQIAGSKEKVIFVYKTKHSDADELARILDKIYTLMLRTGAGFAPKAPLAPDMPPGFPFNGSAESMGGLVRGGPGANNSQIIPGQPRPPGTPPGAPIPLGANGPPQVPLAGQQNQTDNSAQQDVNTRNIVQLQLPPPPPILPTADQIINTGFYETGQYIINPTPVTALTPVRPKSRDPDRNNFIVDLKTGSIIMVVEEDSLGKLKELIAKLDVPKEMVQIEVLLFEKRLNRANSIGINLLRIGDIASQTHATSATFNDILRSGGQGGVFSFLISRTKTSTGIPAFDLIYNFLIAQDDLQINSAPSLVTVNQTPALIAIQEEISISTGQFLVNTNNGEPVLKDAFTRAQYGITIKVTPSIHLAADDDPTFNDNEGDYVTLESEILFDTIQPISRDPNRPDVTRRKLTNLVRVPDGQSVIIGGLRRKISTDNREAIPFLGEVPGVGKLFSHTRLTDSNTEMFLVITPRIIRDPYADFERLKCLEMSKRPGDLPDFLCMLADAREREKNRLLAGSMTLLFGPEPDRCLITPGEYDGW